MLNAWSGTWPAWKPSGAEPARGRVVTGGGGHRTSLPAKATLLETAVFAFAPPAMAQIHDKQARPALGVAE